MSIGMRWRVELCKADGTFVTYCDRRAPFYNRADAMSVLWYARFKNPDHKYRLVHLKPRATATDLRAELKEAKLRVEVVGNELTAALEKNDKLRAQLHDDGEEGPGKFQCGRCTRWVPNAEGGDDDSPDDCAQCWRLGQCEKERDAARARIATLEAAATTRNETMRKARRKP